MPIPCPCTSGVHAGGAQSVARARRGEPPRRLAGGLSQAPRGPSYPDYCSTDEVIDGELGEMHALLVALQLGKNASVNAWWGAHRGHSDRHAAHVRIKLAPMIPSPLMWGVVRFETVGGELEVGTGLPTTCRNRFWGHIWHSDVHKKTHHTVGRRHSDDGERAATS